MAFLDIKNIKKSFNQNEVLKDISLEVEKGEVVVILGPSGCGKTTLLRCINGLEEIQGGEIFFNGELISNQKKNRTQIAQKIGMVFQSYDLFPHLNVMDNILLGPVKAQKQKKKEAESEAVKWLKRIGLEDKINAFPEELSGGQKQRVAIVRALCMHPEIILFDEVTAALDPGMIREVLDVMMNLADEGKTMLIVTHQISFARAVADKIVFMDGGKILETGTSESFWENPKTQQAKDFLQTFEF
ncbi:MAG: amino acid ABC transporter ATP-binding protein [Spirochaetia bacterium]|nr:amino acid ABC transporter ATP-binding protein [Spirochaetia bacterium]